MWFGNEKTFWMGAHPTRLPFTQGLSCLGLYFFPSLLLQFFLSLFHRRVACTTTWQLKIEDAPEIICDACWISATAVWYSTNRILIFMQHSCIKDQSSRLLGIRREKLQPRIRVAIHLFWKAVIDQMFQREREPMVHGHSKAIKIRPTEFKIITFCEAVRKDLYLLLKPRP